MWRRRSRSKEERREPEAEKRWSDHDPTIDQGVYYLYLIIGLQVLFVFAIMGIIMFIGKVISTPGWVFLFMFALFAASMVYIYRKAKKQLRSIKESFGKADRNYEISIMGGMLTMRIEQNQSAPKLLEATFPASAEPVIDAETKEAGPARKPAHLS
jgi:membrane protein implicated in regulation of membrane protease activity